MFCTETPFEVQEWGVSPPIFYPPIPSSLCFKAMIRCDSLSKLSQGFIPSVLKYSLI